MQPLRDDQKKVSVCSRKCQDILRQYKKQDYDKKKRRERWDARNHRLCENCGKRLRRRGRLCSKCRKKVGRFYVSIRNREYQFVRDE